ncbi:MAG: hypothetical protein FJ117_19485 [Deltaproteobacteria bacterium]|nr:hypothetical protein [Deltaproteobacteria bacterium]
MKKGMFALLAVLFVGLLAFVPLAGAQHGHGGGAKDKGMKMDTREVLVEGMKITFAIMANKEHRKMLDEMKMKEEPEPGTTHNISVTLKDQKGKDVTDAQINMKVIDPKGKDQIKPLKYEDMMKSYDAYFNLTEKGKHQILVLVKTGDQKRTAGIYYEVK